MATLNPILSPGKVQNIGPGNRTTIKQKPIFKNGKGKKIKGGIELHFDFGRLHVPQSKYLQLKSNKHQHLMVIYSQ